MSLLDALLLEPPKSEREVWIALRTDGQLGSGTQADPWDGSTIKSAPIEITELTRPDQLNEPLKARAITAGDHGFEDNDLVPFYSQNHPNPPSGGVDEKIVFKQIISGGGFASYDDEIALEKDQLLKYKNAGAVVDFIISGVERDV